MVKFNIPWDIWNEKDKKKHRGISKFVIPLPVNQKENI